MKRLLAALAMLVAAAAFGVPAAAASYGDNHDGHDGDHAAETFCVDGVAVSADNVIAGIAYSVAAKSGGYYSFQWHLGKFTFPGYSLSTPHGDVLNVVFHSVTAGACPVASVVTTNTQNSVFLCYSKWQVEPGVWSFDTAKSLMDGGGYWMPYAVPDTVPYGTNIGGYHLVCNIASTQSVNGSMLGAGADVYSPDVAKAVIGDAFGPFYPVVGG